MKQQTFTIWIVLSVATIVLALVMMIRAAKAELCHRKIDNTIERLGGYRWNWRTVDGKQCWYYSRHVLPKEDLVWSFTETEFNSDVDRILERKFYKPVLDENQLLIEAD